MTTIYQIFGKKFSDPKERIKSYEFLQKFIDSNHSWKSGISPDSEALGLALQNQLKSFSNEDFSFLLCHSGFIPEEFEPDSSEETIYTKMIEVVVSEWAKRLQFLETVTPTAKSSKEDVTIKDSSHVIVCDAKSFRLGRSQKAPNVKDALKEGDIAKWLLVHGEAKHKTLGGMVTFPSQHDWTGGSDFYLYLTKKDAPIVCLFYEHLAFILQYSISKDVLISLYQKYGDLFPEVLKVKSESKQKYWRQVTAFLFAGKEDDWSKFNVVAQQVISEKILHTIRSVEAHLLKIKEDVKLGIPEDATKEDLRQMLVDARTERQTHTVTRQLGNILVFRSHIADYLADVGSPTKNPAL